MSFSVMQWRTPHGFFSGGGVGGNFDTYGERVSRLFKTHGVISKCFQKTLDFLTCFDKNQQKPRLWTKLKTSCGKESYSPYSDRIMSA